MTNRAYMNTKSHHQLAQQFLESMGGRASPEEMAALCLPDLKWNIPGDASAQPWIGEKRGRQALADFMRDAATLLTREALNINDVLSNDQGAVVLGHLRSRVNATGKVIDSHFALVLKFVDDKLASFMMLEDSFAVSAASYA
jgi:ketosteroid isomerase-like protein